MMNHRPEFKEIAQGWNPPTELGRSIPREVRLTRAGVAVMVVAFAMLAAAIASGVGLGMRTAREKRRIEAIQTSGQDAEAVVTRRWRTSGESPKYRLAYTFEWQGQIYGGESSVPRSRWSAITEDSRLPIRFVPSKPEWNYAKEWPGKPLPPFVPVVAAAFFLLAGFAVREGVRRQKSLIAEGRTAPARILKRRTHHNGEGGTQTIVTYEFALPGGAIVKGRANSRKGRDLGSVQCAIYLPENPRRNGLYPLELAKPAG